MDRETSGMPLRRELTSTVPCTADVRTRPSASNVASTVSTTSQ